MHKLALSLGGLVLASTCMAQNWVQVQTKNSPGARWSHSTAHDFVRNLTILFGGTGTGGTYMNDTWEYDGKDWTQLKPKTVPPGRRLQSMVFHLARVNTVLFGGSGTGGALLNDTWIWDGKDWKKMNPTNSPSGRFGYGIAYDAARARTVLFGGNSASGRVNDTWEWDGANWTKITTQNAPSARYTTATYDSARKRVVVFGGTTNGLQSGCLNDTWEYDGVNWTKITTKNSPSARFAGLAYDSARKLTVLFGGFAASARYVQGTWEYDGTDWKQIKPAKEPSARYDFDPMVYDQRRKRMVIYGGITAGGRAGDTWEYGASQSLTGSPSTISIASGGAHAFALDAGTTQANRLYWIFGSVTGTSPGVTLFSPAGSVNIPLNPDVWTDITIALANTALLTKTRGTLDASGKGTATFNVPKITNQSAIGVKFYHAFLVYDANGNFYMASNPAEMTLVK